MDHHHDFNSLIPNWYQDIGDPFLFQDTTIPYPDQPIFPDLQINHGDPCNSTHDSALLMSSTITTTPPPPAAPPQVVSTAAAATNSSAAAAAAAATNKKGKRLRRPTNTTNDNEEKEKRALHRDIERQRRQEMANLYASLRTLLPLEYIKGKRATTDHIHQAVNYIKDMEGRIKELESRRNKLRSQLAAAGGENNNNNNNTAEARRSSPSSSSSSSASNVAFTVRSCSGGGLEILIKSDSADDCFPLSKVLSVLLSEGLAVVSCVYTKVDENFHCTIQTDEGGRQMNDSDLGSLQQKLDAKVIEWKSLGPC